MAAQSKDQRDIDKYTDLPNEIDMEHVDLSLTSAQNNYIRSCLPFHSIFIFATMDLQKLKTIVGVIGKFSNRDVSEDLAISTDNNSDLEKEVNNSTERKQEI